MGEGRPRKLVVKNYLGFSIDSVSHYGNHLSKVATKPPLIIERACFSKALETENDQTRTKEDIEAFVRLALLQRFDSTILESNLLGVNEAQARVKEQKDLSQRTMSQRLIIQDVKVIGDIIEVDADKLLIAGELRSSFRFPVKVSVSSVSRSDSNPYGLRLESVTSALKEVKK